MNAVLAATVKRTLLGAGHYARRLGRDRFPGVAVLCYHAVRADDWPAGTMSFEELHVRAGELEAHCRLLGETCHPISLEQWWRALAGGPPLPDRPVLVTFDDGYRSVLTLARPILRRHRIPAVVFACSAPIEKRELLWYDVVARARGEAEVERLKRAPYSEWAAAAATPRPALDDDPHAPLSITELRALVAEGIEIGAHTVEHSILARAGRTEQRAQIASCKAALELWTGRPVRAFAYPNGRPGEDYTAETVGLVAEAGFDFGFTTRSGFATPDEGALERSRFIVLARLSAAELAHRLAYSWRR